MEEKLNFPISESRGLIPKIQEARWSFSRLAVQVWGMLFLSLTTAVEYASAQTSSPIPPLETIIARMALARNENQSRFRSYVVTRDYKLLDTEKDKTRAQVVADVRFIPPNSKEYSIQQTSGMGLGELIVRRMLASEAEIAKDFSSTDISPDNYDFRFLREEEVSGQHCYVLELTPRRKDRHLLRGNIWVDAKTYLIRRTEGEPAKTLSWWLRDVRIALRYEDVSGMWLQTALEATATVRILGQYTMVSHDVKYYINEVVVAARPKHALEADPARSPWMATALGAAK
jgi:outer membrane lipoprotein-sorting protein